MTTENQSQLPDKRLEEIAPERLHLLCALCAARDLLAAVQKETGRAAFGEGYLTTMTAIEMQVAQGIQNLDSIIKDEQYALSLLQQPTTSERFAYEAEIKNRLSRAVDLLWDIRHALWQLPLHFRENVAEPIRHDYQRQAARLSTFLEEVAKPLSVTSERCGECGHGRKYFEAKTFRYGDGSYGCSFGQDYNDACGCKCVFPAADAASVDVDGLVFQLQCAAVQRHVLEPDHNSNWRDCEFSSCAQARATLDRYYDGAATGAQPEFVPDWRWYDTYLRATGYEDLANRMRAEFKPGVAVTGANEGEPERCRLCGAEFPEDAPFGSRCGCATPPANVAEGEVPTHRCNGVNGAERHGTQNKCTVCGEYRSGWFDSSGMEVCAPTTAPADLLTANEQWVRNITPSATSSSEAVIEAAREIVRECYTLSNLSDPVYQRKVDQVVAIISKYITPDGGAKDPCVEAGYHVCGPLDHHTEANRLRAEMAVMQTSLRDARANAIREAIEVVQSYDDSIGNPSRNIVRALQSLLDKTPDVGETERLRAENKQLREQVDRLYDARDRLLRAGQQRKP